MPVTTSGRRRSSRVDREVREATLALLAETGYARLRMDDVATRAGVGKAAIYRRWTSKAELVFSQVVHDLAIEPPADTGSLRGDLEALVAVIVRCLTGPTVRPVLTELLVDLDRDPRLAARFNDTFVATERACVAAVLERATARGELTTPPELDWAHAQLLGPVWTWLQLLRRRPDEELVRRTADMAVAAWTAPVSAPGGAS